MISLLERREKFRTYFSLTINECIKIGYDSLFIVSIVSIFMGAVTTIQTAFNLVGPLIPDYVISLVVRDMTLLELSPTIIAIVFAGKVGSNIAGELGTMRITEQIDALEVMGINSINYLVFPKVIALLLYPFLISIAMFLGILGGMAACVYGGYSTMSDFILGIQTDFIPFHMTYAFIKTFVFAFILATVPAFHGYYMKGGALEVGKASTLSFIWTCVTIIVFNFFINAVSFFISRLFQPI